MSSNKFIANFIDNDTIKRKTVEKDKKVEISSIKDEEFEMEEKPKEILSAASRRDLDRIFQI